MTTYNFNLIDREWLWAIWRKDGCRELISLQTALTYAQDLREIHGDTPPETAALHRLLLTVMYRIFNPESEWGKLWQAKQLDANKIDGYLHDEMIYTHFDLFDVQHPFFQLAQGAPAWSKYKTVTVSNLRPHYASGNDAVLFDHRSKDAGMGREANDMEGGTSLTAAEAARALISQQAFGISGLNDRSAPNKVDISFSNAPCARGVIFLLEGNTLFETLMLNFFSLDLEKDYGLPQQTTDKPVWESHDPFKDDAKRPYGYLDYATWLNRKVLLLPEGDSRNPIVRRMLYYVGMKRMTGNPLNPLMGLRPNPNLSKKKKDDGSESSHLPLVFREERSLWRDSGPLFAWKEGQTNNYIAPRAFEWIYSEMPSLSNIESDRQFFFSAYGISSESGKDKMYSYRAERFPLPIAYLKDAGRDAAKQLQLALQRAEDVAKILSLYGALGTFACHILGIEEEDKLKEGNKDRIKKLMNATGAERYFWSRLEPHFVRLVQDLPYKVDEATRIWDEGLKQLAHQSFEQAVRVTGGTRALHAYGLAANRFDSQLYRAFNLLPEEGKTK